MPLYTKEKDKMIISLVKSKPFLYKPSVPGYKDQLAKSLAWEEFSEKLEIPVPALRRRWKYIMHQYRKKPLAKLQNDLDSTIQEIKTDLRDRMYKKKINGKWRMLIASPSEKDINEELDEADKSYFSADTDEARDSDDEDRIYNGLDSIRAELNENFNTKKRKVNSNNLEEFDTKFKRHCIVNSSNKSKNSKSSDILDSFKQKLSLCMTEIEIYKRISKIQCDSEKSPMHKFFEEAASIVAMFPPHLGYEISLKIYKEVLDREMYFK